MVRLPNMLLHLDSVAPLELSMHTNSPGGRRAQSLQRFLLHEYMALSAVKPGDGFYTERARGHAQLFNLV